MKVGDLVRYRTTITKDWGFDKDWSLGIITEGYDSPKKIWIVYWLEEKSSHPCSEKSLEVLNESR